MKKVREEWVEAYKSSGYLAPYAFPSIRNALLNFFKRGSLVLEAGCGNGSVCFCLEERGVSSIGIDIAPNIVRRAHLSAKTRDSEVQFIIGDVTHLPLRNASVDGVVSLGVIEHFRLTDEAFQAFRESNRVLRNDGKAFFTVPNIFVPLRNRFILFFSRGMWGMYHKSYTVNGLTRLARLSGFTSLHADVVDLWLPIFFVIDGLIKILRVDEKVRLKTYHCMTKLPRIPFTKIILGHILLTARMPVRG